MVGWVFLCYLTCTVTKHLVSTQIVEIILLFVLTWCYNWSRKYDCVNTGYSISLLVWTLVYMFAAS